MARLTKIREASNTTKLKDMATLLKIKNNEISYWKDKV
jgi:hypothetical protein